MRKIILTFSLFVLILLGFTQKTHANHLLGMDIQWKSVGNDTFLITITAYRRCTDGADNISYPNFSITSDSCASSNVVHYGSAISHSVEDITPICPTAQKICPSAGGSGQSTAQIPIGIERHIWIYKIYLGDTFANCCWYKIRTDMCCRNSNITTGYADANFYTESWLNHCVAPYDNGPEFRNPPIAIKCAGQDVCYNHGVYDADGDSLSFAMAPPLGGGYSSPWSYNYPLTCLGGNNPNPNANPPTGFYLDPRTSEMCFRPMQVQNTVMKVMVTEWRKNAQGKYKVIGKTARDMQFSIVQNCNNKLPSLSGPFAYEACAGQEICITINTNDQDLTDSTKISWNEGIPGATWNKNNGTVKRATSTLCWTPTTDDASSLPHYFTTSASDNHCPLVGSITRSYSILVADNPIATRKFLKIKEGKYVAIINKDSTSKSHFGIVNIYQPVKLGSPSSNAVLKTIGNQDLINYTFYLPDTGIYIFKISIKASACFTLYYDTIDTRKNIKGIAVSGSLFESMDSTGVKSKNDIAISNSLITTVPFFCGTYTDDQGKYTMYLDSGTYQIKPALSETILAVFKNYIFPLGGTHLIKTDTIKPDTIGINFAVKLYRVPILVVDFIEVGMRPCVSHYGYFDYANNGTEDAENVEIVMILPPNTQFLGADRNYTFKGDTLIFSLGKVSAGTHGKIRISTIVDCINGIVGQFRCFKFWIAPDNKKFKELGLDTAYDSSFIKTTITALDSNYLKFTIGNTGKLMSDSNDYRLYENSLLCKSGKFKLKEKDQFEFIIKSNNSTYRLEANQAKYYPGHSNPCTMARTSWDATKHDTTNYNDLPPYYEGHTLKEKCYEIVDSYDPNEMSVIPAGVGTQKIVQRNETLHYRIDFQNTGSDTAYNIVIVDTLSALLDFKTLKINIASHAFKTDIVGTNPIILRFEFEKIYLVDSAKDEKNSHGFITYSIAPNKNIVSGSKINSRAFIYFDFNTPVETNTAFVSIKDARPVSTHYPIESFPVPNIVLDTITDLCAMSNPINLDIRTSLNPKYISSTRGQWYINGTPINDNIFDPSKLVFATGSSSPIQIKVAYKFNSLGMISSDSTSFKVYPNPTVILSNPKKRYCECDTSKQYFKIFNSANNNLITETAYSIDQKLHSNNYFVPSNFKMGMHYIMLKYQTQYGCNGIAIDSFYIEAKPQVTILPIRNLCEWVAMNPDSGFKLEFTINAPYTGHWINYVGTFIRGTHDNDPIAYYLPSPIELAKGEIQLEWERNDIANNDCPKTTTKATALIYAKPVFKITTTNKAGCAPFAAKFACTIENSQKLPSNLIYLWEFGDAMSSSNNKSNSITPIHFYERPGIYKVSCTITNPLGHCSSTIQYLDSVKIFEMSQPWFEFTPDSPGYTTNIAPKFTFTSFNKNANASIKEIKWWYDEPVNYNIPDATGAQVTHMYPADSGFHVITLQQITVDGCASEVKRLVRVYPDIKVFIPNAFSPDGVANNEKFMVVASNIKNFEVSIYNRWGDRVYFSNNYASHGWDGNYQNKQLPIDVYIYKINIIGMDSKQYEYAGTLQLVR